MKQLRWYGWGSTDRAFAFEERPDAWAFLCAALNLSGDERYPPCDFASIALREPRVDLQDLGALAQTDTRKFVRLLHSYGKSYRDLVRLRRGEVFNPPDVVVYPANEDQVMRLLHYCREHDYTLIPCGGGSSMVGGVEPRDPRVTLALDLKKMNRVLAVDDIAQTATIEPGIWGPDLESYLNARGLTLGHFPTSFEYSTLGGWLATRGIGAAAPKYGAIADMTLGLRVAAPSGLVESRLASPSATGPALMQMFLGSEGALGVITQATLRLHALPKIAEYRAMIFRNFADGVAAIHDIFQSDLLPTTLQLSDEAETRSVFALRKRPHGMKDWAETAERRALQVLGYSFEHGALLRLGFEGDGYTVNAVKNHVLGLCQANGAFDLGADLARAWLAERYELPYLRDALMDHGVMMDTLETAVSWSQLESLYKNLTSALQQIIQEIGARALVLTHLSHGSRAFAHLRVTVLAHIALHREIEHWESIQRVATACIVENGGTVSPHHGIGYEHARWLKQTLGAPGYAALLALKQQLDPTNIMNPGKLLLDSSQ